MSHLKKEFDERAVNRARNLITKNYSARSLAGTGYEKKREKHSEGDVWEEDGRTWTIKNGVKQNITKLDIAKKAYRVPLSCPKCKGSMNYHLHQKMYKIHKMCFDCVTEYETQLMANGLYEKYEKAMIMGSMRAFAIEARHWITDTLTTSDNFVTEDGTIEDWKHDRSKEQQTLLTKLDEFLAYIEEQED